MSYLFLFTITPVQDFISQSRKLKDLFGSSEILSCMSYIGMRICKKYGGEIIFPYFEDVLDKSYPNRFLVKFDKDKDKEEIKIIAKEIEESLLKYLRGLNNLNQKHIETKIKEHIENYFTFYLAFSEIRDSYKNAFDEVEKLLAGAKNTRFFTQLGNGEGERDRKCSICGERNVVVRSKNEDKKSSLYKITSVTSSYIQKGEGLCGVCYVKRVNSSENFESTAEVALIHIFNKLEKSKYKYLEKDAQLFFEENLTKNYFEKNDIKLNLEEGKKEFKNFKEDLKANNLKQTSYYAVVMFDGDSMGDWLSGGGDNKNKKIPDNKLKDFHNDLSQKLGEFAKEVRNIIKSPKNSEKNANGLVVYAGGEDFLGFVNINYLFDVLKELRKTWNEIVANPLQQKFNTKDKITFSAGVVIAHYKTPLYAVLQKVREAERKAKEYDSKKDKICFVALKRNGEIREAVVPYNHITHLENIFKELKTKFSDGFISVLEREFDLMTDDNGVLDIDKRVSLLLIEIKRLLSRAKKIQNITSEYIDSFTGKEIRPLITKNFTNFANTLNIIRFIKRESNDNSN